ncbi:hypothetical protein [Halobacteriovorax sp.]|uniref:hypothetical protein n=1 Tax=Halobacteriovorax sp. TaxID=2020862 RepID=UPI00356738C4
MKFILSLLIGSNCFAANYIDLGNLEIEGELRRPAINLFINTEMVKDNLKEYARIKVEKDITNIQFDDNSSDLIKYNKNEAKWLEL